MTEPFSTAVGQGIAEMVLHRPPVNAFDSVSQFAMAAELGSLGRRDDVRVIVIAAEGKGFFAGIDVKEVTADPSLIVAVNRAKAGWPQAAEEQLGGLAWIRAVCAPLGASTPLLSLNRFCLANHVNAVCLCRSSILLLRMAPKSARNRPSAPPAGCRVGFGPSPPQGADHDRRRTRAP